MDASNRQSNRQSNHGRQRRRLLWLLVQPLVIYAQFGEGGECVEPCQRNFACDPGRCTETAFLPAQKKLSWSWDLGALAPDWESAAVDYTFSALDDSLLAVALVETSSERKVLDKLKRNKRRTADDAGWLMPESRCVRARRVLALVAGRTPALAGCSLHLTFVPPDRLQLRAPRLVLRSSCHRYVRLRTPPSTNRHAIAARITCHFCLT
jgi:hypothetical protein